MRTPLRLDQFARAPVPRRAQVVRGFSGAVVGRGGSGDDEEGPSRPFEQDDLGRAAGLGERSQVFRQDGRVGGDGLHYSRPCMRLLVQTHGAEGVRARARRRKRGKGVRQNVGGWRTVSRGSYSPGRLPTSHGFFCWFCTKLT
jgi:hypothetical protein